MANALESNQLVVSGATATVSVCDLSSLAVSYQIPEDGGSLVRTGSLQGICAPSEETLAFGPGSSPYLIPILHLRSRRVRGHCGGHTTSVRKMTSVSPVAKLSAPHMFVSGASGPDRCLRLWDSDMCVEVVHYRGGDQCGSPIRFSSELGNRVFAGCGSCLLTWELKKNTAHKTELGTRVCGVSVDIDRELVYANVGRYDICAYSTREPESRAIRFRTEIPQSEKYRQVADVLFHPASQSLLVHDSTEILVYDVRNFSSCVRRFEVQPQASSHRTEIVLVAEDTFASVNESTVLAVWTSDGKVRQMPFRKGVYCVFSAFRDVDLEELFGRNVDERIEFLLGFGFAAVEIRFLPDERSLSLLNFLLHSA